MLVFHLCSLAPLLFDTSVIWHLCYLSPLLFGGGDDEPYWKKAKHSIEKGQKRAKPFTGQSQLH